MYIFQGKRHLRCGGGHSDLEPKRRRSSPCLGQRCLWAEDGADMRGDYFPELRTGKLKSVMRGDFFQDKDLES